MNIALDPTPVDPVIFVYSPAYKKMQSVAAQEASTLPYEQFQPVRAIPKYKGQKNSTGFYWSATDNRSHEHESHLESQTMMLLDFDADIIAMAAQPLEIRAMTPELTWRHVPDLFTRHRDGSPGLCDVKNPAALRSRKVQRQLQLTAQVCADAGFRYEVHTTPDEVLYDNIYLLSTYRRPIHGHETLMAEIVAHALEPISIGELANLWPDRSLTLAAVHHLCWFGLLRADLSRRMTSRTLVEAVDVDG